MVLTWTKTIWVLVIFATGWVMNNCYYWMKSLDEEYNKELRKRKQIQFEKQAKERYLRNLEELEEICGQD